MRGAIPLGSVDITVVIGRDFVKASSLTQRLRPRALRARIVADAADSKKGEDIVVLDVGDIMSLAEIFVIVSAPNTRLVRTIVDDDRRAHA